MSAVVAIALAGGALWWAQRPDRASAASGGATSSAPSGATATGDEETCRVSIAAPEAERLAATLGAAWTSGGGGCVVEAAGGGDADLTLGGADGEQLATTAAVLAMPTAMATALGWSPGPLSSTAWQQVLLGEQTWSDTGHPDWGSFRVALPDPATDALGALGYGTLLGLANGAPLTKAPSFTSLTRSELSMLRVEHRSEVLADAAAAVALLDSPDVDAFAAKASALVTTEAAVLARNGTPGAVPWTAFTLPGAPTGVPVRAAVANDDGARLVAFLKSPAGSALLGELGYWVGTTPPARAGSEGAAPVAASVTQIGGGQALWTALHQRFSTMAVVDLSGSMNAALPGGSVTKLELVRDLATKAYTLASPKAFSGLWFFNTDAAHRPTIRRSFALQRNDSTDGGSSHSEAVIRGLRGAKASGDTPLYEAIRDAYAYANDHYVDGAVNQLFVLSDGADEDSTSTVTLAAVREAVRKRFDPDRPVHIIAVLTDPGANLEEVRSITDLTQGRTIAMDRASDGPRAMAQALFGQ